MRATIFFVIGMMLAAWTTAATAADKEETQSGHMHGSGMQMEKDDQHGEHGGHGAMHNADPSTADYATTRWSEHHRFQVSYAPSTTPVPTNALQSWTLTVTDQAGRTVPNAVIEVDGDMPEHGHGLPTTPKVRNLGGGKYLLEGLKFHMPGWWVVTLDISAAGASDEATFNLKLE